MRGTGAARAGDGGVGESEEGAGGADHIFQGVGAGGEGGEQGGAIVLGVAQEGGHVYC